MFFYWFLKIICYIPFWLLYPTIIKKETKVPKGKCIFICNHKSNIEPLILMNAFWRIQHTVSKKELFKKWYTRPFLKAMKAIPIDRDKVDISAVKLCLSVLKKNETLTIFPEGTRNKTNEPLLPIKDGTGIFAIKSNAPVVPMWIKKRPKLFVINTIYIGKEFYINKEDAENANEIIKQKLLNLREKYCTLKK